MAIQLPDVTRIHTEHGSHIEPPLDERWPERDQLAWKAALTAHDTGLPITLSDDALILHGKPRPGWYAITVGTTGMSAVSFPLAWAYLNGVATGAKNAKEAQA